MKVITNPHRRKLTEDEIIELLQEGATGLIAGIGRVSGIDCMVAVSYTHLRAHETVLDLVCRLLLEKKKKQRKKKINNNNNNNIIQHNRRARMTHRSTMTSQRP